MKVAVLLLAFFVSSDLRAQNALGAISGTIKDSTGALVPGATVKVANEATGVAETVASGENGAYLTPPLAPGAYKVTVTVTGFKQAEVGSP